MPTAWIEIFLVQNISKWKKHCKEIKPVNPKGNQSWIFIGRTDAEAETSILWPPYAKIWLLGRDSDARKVKAGEENRMTEDEMVGWHHWLNGHEFEQALGVGDGHAGLVCCSSWGREESDMIEWLNWTGKLMKHDCCCHEKTETQQ